MDSVEGLRALNTPRTGVPALSNSPIQIRQACPLIVPRVAPLGTVMESGAATARETEVPLPDTVNRTGEEADGSFPFRSFNAIVKADAATEVLIWRLAGALKPSG